MDIVEWLRELRMSTSNADWNSAIVNNRLDEAADEIERLREALKTFADNVRETNAEIDKNWAKTIYPLKAENQRLREALKEILAHETDYEPYDCIEIARTALKEGE